MSAHKRNSASSLNFRSKIQQPESTRSESKGSKPLPNPVTIKEALFTLLIHVFRKILFVNPKIKVALYLAGLFLSFIFDFMPFPRSYFSRSHNFLNVYFVKIGWFWTLVVTVPFVFLTSFTYCCGKRPMVLMHLSRLLIATGVWYAFTSTFGFIDENLGRCSMQTVEGKRTCLSRGHNWYGLDISGHTFLLIWSAMVITEEARVIVGWNQVANMIQNEEHLRVTKEVDVNSNLRLLSNEEFVILKASYKNFSSYVKGLFVALTALALLWDFMVLITILYFHIMVEKLVAGVFAIGMWYATYRFWYPKLNIPPRLPGDGSFKYITQKMKS